MITSGGNRKPAKPDLDADTRARQRRISPAWLLAVMRPCNSAVYVVGDTPLDIAAGRAAHATTVGVASGHYRADELHAAQADYVVQSLTDPFPGLDGSKAGKQSG